MTVKEAKELLKTAPNNGDQCQINPIMTTADFHKIMLDSMNSQAEKHGEEHVLHNLLKKRIYQCVRNQRHPRY